MATWPTHRGAEKGFDMPTAQQMRVAREVHDLFVASEKLADQASLQIAVCQSRMQIAAGELGVPIATGLRALEKVSEANALMVRARHLIIQAHPLMKKIPGEIGLDDGYGHMEETPKFATKFEPPADQPEPLRAVA